MQPEKTALITGASAGIGAEFAKQLHELGYNLILIARRENLLSKITEELNKRRPNSAKFKVVDLSDKDQLNQVAEEIRSTKIDLLVNNVGRGSFGPFEELELASEIQMVDINIITPLVLAHAVIPQMKQRRSGVIISVSSIAAFQPLPYMASYAATKAFNFIHSLALKAELRSFGIKVVTLCPGPTATEFGGVARVPGTLTGGKRDTVELVVKRTIAAIGFNPLGYVVPGFRSLLISLSSRILPFCCTTYFAARILGRALKHRSEKR